MREQEIRTEESPCPAQVSLQTPRLLLRPWRDADREPFARLNANPVVMEHFPGCLSREESDAVAGRMAGLVTRQGWGFWVMERREDGRFLGIAGLNRLERSGTAEDMPFALAVEVGWRLDRPFWGNGYASEAARFCLDFAWNTLCEQEIVAFTAISNTRSQAVMRRLGMSLRGNFEHPRLPLGHPLRPHVLFALRCPGQSGQDA